MITFDATTQQNYLRLREIIDQINLNLDNKHIKPLERAMVESRNFEKQRLILKRSTTAINESKFEPEKMAKK